MKKEIEDFKSSNGNNVFTNKEMIMYIISKVDKIDDRLDSYIETISANKTSISNIKTFIKVGVFILLSTLSSLFYIIIKIGGL